MVTNAQQDDSLALLQKIAASGDTLSQVRLALCYQRGHGVKKDYQEAVKWFTKAAEKNDPDALLALGMAYDSGKGVGQDSQKSAELIQKSAESGHPMAMCMYGQALASNPEKHIDGVAFIQVGTYRLLETDPASGMQFLAALHEFQKTLTADQDTLVQQRAANIETTIPYIETLIGHVFPLGPMIFQQADAEKIVDEILPEVEKAAGRKFKTKPVVKVASRYETATSLARDIYPQLRNLAPHQPEEQTKKDALNQAFTTVQSLLGKYGFHDKTLYLLPRNMSLIMDKLGINASFTPSLVRVLVAHEMTHVLQDQYLDLTETLLKIKGQEAMSAFNALIEGHAMFVQDSLGTALGLDREVIEFARFMSAGATPEERQREEDMIDHTQVMARRMFQEVYLGGRAFVDGICRIHGRNRLWDVLENPPLRTSVISFPDTYTFGKQTPPPNLSPILAGMESLFGNGPWQTQLVEIGTMQIKALYANMAPDKLNSLLPRIVTAYALAFGHPQTQQPNALSLFLMRDEGSVRDLLDNLEVMARNNIQRLSNSGQLVIKDIQFVDISVPGADTARKIAFRIGAKEGSMESATVFRIALRSLMIEIEDHHLHLAEPQIAEIVQEIQRRHAAFREKSTANLASDEVKTTAANVTTTQLNDDETNLKTGIRHFKHNDFRAARSSLQQILQKQPPHAQAHFLMAVMAAREKSFEDAWKFIDIAQRAAPGHAKIEAFIKRLQSVAPR